MPILFELSEPLKRQSVYVFVSLMEGMGNKEHHENSHIRQKTDFSKE